MKLSELQPNEYEFVEPKKQGGVLNFLKGVPMGVGKSFGEGILGALETGRAIQKGITPSQSWLGGSSPLDRNNPLNQQARQALEANAPGEGTGKFLGTTMQYLAPTSAITKGQQILGNAATMAPKGLGLASQAAARFLPEAAGTGLVSAIRSGGDIEQAREDGMLAGGFSVGLGALGSLGRSTYWPALQDSVSKALGIQGKKSGGVALGEVAKKTSALRILKDNADKIKVTLDDGTKASFDPTNATYSTTLQAWNGLRKKLYTQYSKLAQKTGDGATVDLTDVRELIRAVDDQPTLSVFKNAAKTLLSDFDNAFKDPSKADIETAEKFLEALNSQTVGGFFKGTSDAASSEINAGTARYIRERLDEVITSATGESYQNIRSQYAALKSIEDDLVRKFQQNARSIGGGISEYAGMFSSGDIVGALFAGDVANLARGTTTGFLAALKRTLSDPERFLKRSFNLIDDEVPSDLYLRIFGGSKPLNAADEATSRNIGASLQNPSLGLSIRDVSKDPSFNGGENPKTTEGAWTGTKSSNASKESPISTNKKPTGKEGVSAPSADTSGGFEGQAWGNGKYKKDGLNPTEIGSWTAKDIASGKSPLQSNVSIESLRLGKQDISFFQDFYDYNKSRGLEGSSKTGYTVYRVVPEGGSISEGDFVFTNKKSAQEFLEKYGKKRGQTEIVSTKADINELLLPYDEQTMYKEASGKYDEFIYAPKPNPLYTEARKYPTPDEMLYALEKEPLEAGIDRKNLAEAYRLGKSNNYVVFKRTGKTVEEPVIVEQADGKTTTRYDKVPELEGRIVTFDENIDSNLYNAFLRAKDKTFKVTAGNEELKSQLTDIWKEANKK